jgi:transposase
VQSAAHAIPSDAKLQQQFDVHAKLGELTLESDFLEGALTKAGLLSEK